MIDGESISFKQKGYIASWSIQLKFWATKLNSAFPEWEPTVRHVRAPNFSNPRAYLALELDSEVFEFKTENENGTTNLDCFISDSIESSILYNPKRPDEEVTGWYFHSAL